MTLSPRWVLNDLDLTSAPYGVERNESDHGAPESVRSVLASMLADGDIDLVDRHSNRTFELSVLLEGTMDEMAAAEADLVTAVSVPRGLLRFSPGDGVTPDSIFETFAGDVVLSQDEDVESAGLRRVKLTIPCRPFARAASLTTIEAPAAAGATTPPHLVMADGTSAADFSMTAVLANPSAGAVEGTSGPTSTGGVVSASATFSSANEPAMSTVLEYTPSTPLPSGYLGGYLTITGSYSTANLPSGRSISCAVRINGTGIYGVSTPVASGTFTAVGPIPAAGVTSVEVRITTGGVTSHLTMTARIDSIAADPAVVASAKIQSRTIQILGSERTELSLAVLGLDSEGTTTQGLGEQVLVHTAAKSIDGRSEFLDCRPAAGLAGTADDTAASGYYNALSTTSSPTSFTFPASSLLPGNYLAVARLRMASAGSTDINLRAYVDPTVGDSVYDPADQSWRVAPLVAAAGATWPKVNTGSWVMIPLGMLRLPPADVEDSAATITIQVARGANAADLDDVWLLNADVGNTSMLLTGLGSGSYSAVRLDAATVTTPQASAWVGAADGTMLADNTRWVGEQHQAAPGLLQIATVTPGCSTSRVSASYYRRYHTHVVDEDGSV